MNFLAAWLNNEPAQTVDVMVYGMQSGSETFLCTLATSPATPEIPYVTQHIDKNAAREHPWAPRWNMDTDVRAFSHSCKTPVRLKLEL